ncbi:hypothetical protein EST62_12705 [Chlorobaculum sp. 24CR]|uniref:hypothetical protein n=1 Tax=Chlorobaculum sp. 24CR TaxID=2508878 RepID=UPI00100B9A9F|nr:hypothetical protein [Chlorobaculum sp. 24CR]RXK80443.1 hypothetical protein EST62_12705 [Chlorobaculum sp. 24CR]
MSNNVDEKQLKNHSIFEAPYRNDDEINLLDIAVILAKHKKAIIGVPVIVAMITALIIGINTRTSLKNYKASIQIYLTESSIPKEAVLSLINSKSMGDSLMKRLELGKLYNIASDKKALNQLLNSVNSSIQNDYITVTINDSDSSRAVKLTNAYPKILGSLVEKFAITETSKRRLIFEKSLLGIKKTFEQSEERLIDTQHSPDYNPPETMVVEMVKKTAALKARIAMKELELFTMASQDMAKYPSYLRLESELNDLWSEFSRIDLSKGIITKVSLKQLEYLRLIRDYQYNETRYEQLVKVIEKSKIDELDELPVIRTISSIEQPEETASSKPLIYIVFSSALSFIIIVLWALFVEAFRNAKNDPKNKVQIESFRRAMKWR